jgi:ELWxxDGT repeat protein
MQIKTIRAGLAACFLAGLASAAQAGTASLVLDIEPTDAEPRQLEVFGMQPMGSSVLLLAEEPQVGDSGGSGREPWITDGTEIGTRPLFDLCPGPCSSSFSLLGTVRKIGILQVDNGIDDEHRLWRSDGTRPGTYPLTPNLGLCGSRPAVVGSALLLGARLQDEPCALWRMDGDPGSAVKLRDVEPNGLFVTGAQAFFTVFTERQGWTLWRTDGTAEGTIPLRLWTTGPPTTFLAAGSRLFFIVREDGRDLWTSDGTVAGTKPVSRFTAPEPFVSRSENTTAAVIEEVDGSACFLANESDGREVWCSDGTESGTRQATRLATASPFVRPSVWSIHKLGGRLLFPANDGLSGNRLWTSDGRPESTAPLSGCPGGCPVLDPDSRMVRVGARLFFAAIGEGHTPSDEPPTTDLWVTDGTGAGTRRLADFCASCRVDRMFSVLGKLYFSAGRYPFSYDIWASDGTPAGTRKLLATDDRSEQVLTSPPTPLGSRVLIDLSGTALGSGLWLSDGTPAGTGQIFLGRDGWGSSPSPLTPTRSGVRFEARSDNTVRLWESRGTAATTAPFEIPIRPETWVPFGDLTLLIPSFDDALWRTDGTEAGTFPLTAEGIELGRPVVLGNRALFVTRAPGDSTASLWSTDGTVAGTRKIATLPQGSATLLPAGDSALIVMYDSPAYILWRTDGTAAGTQEMLLPGELWYNGGAARLGSAFFFLGYTSGEGERVWRSDGTPNGTRPLASSILGTPGNFTVHAGALYVFAHTKAPNESGLFRSDGTDAGTVLLTTVPITTTEVPGGAEFASVGSLLFFTLENERGRELWRSDGTPAGTFLVRDIAPGAGSSNPQHLVALGDRLYFAASDTGSGTELWESDGTEEGTRIVQDIQPGAVASDPEELTVAGGRLFFSADDGVHGRELWTYTPGGAGCEPTATSLCLGGRFRVEAEWRASASGTASHGPGRAAALTADTGCFWFFDPANVEVILKVLDGQGVNGHHWVFYGALSNVEYTLTVTDTQTGAARRYFNPAGRLGSVADTIAFGPLGATTAGSVTDGPAPQAGTGEAVVTTRTARVTEGCAPSSTRLCLNGGRFAVEARWKDFQGYTGAGRSVPLGGGDTGYFWFFDEGNVEVVLKVLDGRVLNGRFWVFYGALSNVEYTLTVTDTVTGVVKEYANPSGHLASVADTSAF